MSSAQEKVLIALTVSILFDAYLRVQNELIPTCLLWLVGLPSHSLGP